ncbi:DMT family transporter [uncultured Sphingomonas sp.]|uniref:DMT family transporter n=1 Tax=uncultured Sphingomonas sp. TaxID=158754 RepID=UPI0035C9807F
MSAARPQSTRLTILLPFAIVTLIWGSTWIVIRDQLGVVPATWSVSYRFVVAGLVMSAWALWRRDPWTLGARGWLFAAATALLQFCGNFNAVYQAEHYITSGLVAVTFALLLVPNALLARVFLGHRLGGRLIAGSAVAVAGVALLFTHEIRVDPNGPAVVAAGIAWTLLGVLAASASNVMQATATARSFAPAPLLATAMLLGAAFDAALAWTLDGPPVFEWRWGYVAGIVYLGVFASAVAFTLYFGILRVIGPAKAAYSSVIVPVIAMLLSTLFEGYRWSALAAGGAALTGVGLVIALSTRRPTR